MRKMKIEKNIKLNNIVARVEQIQIQENLQYLNEDDGIRASGPLYIKGDYLTADKVSQNFIETLEMDVLAPSNKLNGEPFLISINKYHWNVENDEITVFIEFQIAGINNSEVVDEVSDYIDKNAGLMQKLQQNTVEEDNREDDACFGSNEDEKDIETKTVENANTIKEFEDVFEDANTTYTSYRLIVAKSEDTYSSIANRYEVNEDDLKTSNNNKNVEAKTLIVLPFK